MFHGTTLCKFIENHSDTFVMVFSENVIEKRCFSSSYDCYWKVIVNKNAKTHRDNRWESSLELFVMSSMLHRLRLEYCHRYHLFPSRLIKRKKRKRKKTWLFLYTCHAEGLFIDVCFFSFFSRVKKKSKERRISIIFSWWKWTIEEESTVEMKTEKKC